MYQFEKSPKGFRYILFLLFFFYAILYIFPFPLTFIGIFSKAGEFFHDYTWYKLVPWVGHSLFGITEVIDTTPNGSGDRLFNWVQIPVLMVFAILFTILWALLIRKRISFQVLNRWISSYVLAFLICSMIVYGMVKVIKLQFPDPSLVSLTTQVGDLTPFRLSWFFLGYSDLYTFFGGLSELLGGVLLLFRRTRTLGALITFGVMTNVWMMNMSYDIPVKLYSFHLVFFTAFILFQDRLRLLNFFFLDKQAKPLAYLEHFSRSQYNIAFKWLKYLLFSAFLIFQFYSAIQSSKEYGKRVALPEHYGIYQVTEFTANGQDYAPGTGTNIRWDKFMIEKHDQFVVRYENATNIPRYYRMEMDTSSQHLLLSDFSNPDTKYSLEYNFAGNILFLNGILFDDTLKIQAVWKDHKEYPLIKKGFNWVNDRPN